MCALAKSFILSALFLARGILVYDEPSLPNNGKWLIRRMTYKAKDLSPDQKTAIEALSGRSISENNEAISIRAIVTPSAPIGSRLLWNSAKEQGFDRPSLDEIDAEMEAARKTHLVRSRRRINPQHLNELRHLAQMPQRIARSFIVAAKKVHVKNVLPRAPAHRTRLDFAQADVAEREHAQ